jgi:hypothetical protein
MEERLILHQPVQVGTGRKMKNHQFKLVTNQQRNYEFQANTADELKGWASAVQDSILWSLNQVLLAEDGRTRDAARRLYHAPCIICFKTSCIVLCSP